MSTAAAEATPPKSMIWGGRVLSALPVLVLLGSAMGKLTHNPNVVGMLTGKFGYPEASIAVIGTIELLIAVIYAVPPTAVLGAVLITGYLGGATATHVRVSDNFIAPVILGVLVWGGLFLRDERVRALLPLRRS